MVYKRLDRYAWLVLGVLGFPWRFLWGADSLYLAEVSSAPVVVSTSALTEGTTEVVEPFVSPIPFKKNGIASGFGNRKVPNLVPPKPEPHEGVDYRAAVGSAVRAARSGKVLFTGFSTSYVSRADKTQKHRFVIVRHADGMSTRYVHMSALRVRPGQEVKSGQVLGMVTESDEWTEPVLHFEIRDAQGQAVNPADWIAPPAPKATSGTVH